MLGNGNFVVCSANWNSGRGAVTWFDGALGRNGAVSSVNSITGGSSGDQVGSGGATALPNGNYIVASPWWSGGRGAATWGNGATGTFGIVSAANSLVGETPAKIPFSALGAPLSPVVTGVHALTNGNYVVLNPYWNDARGAATWGNGATGTSGVISAANSLVGSTVDDKIGVTGFTLLDSGEQADHTLHGVVTLPNSNYVVTSPYWNNGTLVDAGAATWGNGTTGTSGVISVANSLVGTRATDEVGRVFTCLNEFYSGGVVPLANGNYIVVSRDWNSGAAANVGAVTWGNGATGVKGAISSSNSLVGTQFDDTVGRGGVVSLANGNYVVVSPWWNNGSVTHAGAATWGNGATGISGAVSAANSLVGTSNGAWAGAYYWLNWEGANYPHCTVKPGVTPLTNGNYVVSTFMQQPFGGAATWANGMTGITGPVTMENSLVGIDSNLYPHTTADVGLVIALTNGNYVVSSPFWFDQELGGWPGAVTWGNGESGTVGVISPANSLVGNHGVDYVGGSCPPFGHNQAGEDQCFGGVTALDDGNYVVASPWWNSAPNNGIDDGQFGRGAVTWGDGYAGTTGVVSSTNSIVGNTRFDRVGHGGVTALANGAYVFGSPYWANGLAPETGAVTWASGPTAGVVSAANSFVGHSPGDHVGGNGITVLANGDYVIQDDYSSLGTTAVTLGNGGAGVTGIVGGEESIIGALLPPHGFQATVDGKMLVVRPGEVVIAGFEAPTPSLVVQVSGNGSGSVGSSPAGIACGTTCSANFTFGAQVTLTPAPASGSVFSGWTGACTGTGACIVTVDGHKIVSARFSPISVALQVTLAGDGGGTVTGEGIDCGADCSESYAPGTFVTLSAAPAFGSIFAGWSGACSGDALQCDVTVNATTSATASFARVQSVVTHRLTMVTSGGGSGKVVSNPPGIDCGSDCMEDYLVGEYVELYAQANEGSVFAGWSGACSGDSTVCEVTMNTALNAVATFAPEGGATTHTLTVTKSGNGAGSVTSSPGGISCSSTCSAAYVDGVQVSLFAVPNSGSVFTGWSGACSGTGACNVTMTQARNVTAGFAQGVAGQSQLLVTLAGTGAGVVTSSPAGINCGSDCTENYAQSTTVILTATPTSGSTFGGWSGACSGTGACVLSMSAVRSVTATFTAGGDGGSFYQFLPSVGR